MSPVPPVSYAYKMTVYACQKVVADYSVLINSTVSLLMHINIFVCRDRVDCLGWQPTMTIDMWSFLGME